MKNKKETNPYDRLMIVKSNQSVYVSDSREMDIKTLLEKIENELRKRIKTLNSKGSDFVSQTVGYFNFSATIQVKRRETDLEYNKRISNYEKQEQVRRKKEEEKIKREFKKLEELKQKFEDVSSVDEAIMKVRKKRASDSILPNLIKQ